MHDECCKDSARLWGESAAAQALAPAHRQSSRAIETVTRHKKHGDDVDPNHPMWEALIEEKKVFERAKGTR